MSNTREHYPNDALSSSELVTALDPKIIGPYSIPSSLPVGGQPFTTAINDEYLSLKAQISQSGVMYPAIVRPWKYDDRFQYEMISGHRRKEICEELGIPLPCIIRDLDDCEAAITMTVTNTSGRNLLFPSELALAYRIEVEARRQYRKVHPAHEEYCSDKGRVTDEIGKRRNQSARTVSRYFRLTYLIPGILYEFVDPGIIDIVSGEHLSHLPQQRTADGTALFEKRKAGQSQKR